MHASDAHTFSCPGFSIEEVRAHWDNVIELYDRSNGKIGYGHVQRFLHGLSYFSCAQDVRLLNVWARMGEAVPYLRKRFPQGSFLHLEASGAMVEQAIKRFPEEEFRQTDLQTLEAEDASFDAVLSLETLEHCPDPFRFVCELARVIKPGGELVLSCPSATAEPMLRTYELFFENHGEGPHRFPWSWTVKAMLQKAGFVLKEHRGTVFLPVIPDSLSAVDRALGKVLGRTPLGEFGIRQFYYCTRER